MYFLRNLLYWLGLCGLIVLAAYMGQWFKKQQTLPEYNSSILDYIPGQRSWLVLDVIDGDSIVIRLKDKMKAVQLLHVNAPDMGNPLYPECRDALSELIMGQRVTLVFPEGHEYDKDFYGRILAYLKLGNRHINQYMIEHGHAKIREDDGKMGDYQKLKRLQEDARAAKAGIWASTETSRYKD